MFEEVEAKKLNYKEGTVIYDYNKELLGLEENYVPDEYLFREQEEQDLSDFIHKGIKQEGN